jgi:hypothetical protein
MFGRAGLISNICHNAVITVHADVYRTATGTQT